MTAFARMRRYRRTPTLRRLFEETRVDAGNFVLPLFIVSGRNRKEEIAAMPGVCRWSVDLLPERIAVSPVCAVLLFGVLDASEKDATGSVALNPDGPVPAAVRALKAARPDLTIITDVCLCEYTDHGHCGVLADCGCVDNDRTLEQLARMAAIHAEAGADMVAPSAMMDGQVYAIRQRLDASGRINTRILAYAAKFASCFYGPFREAAYSAPSFGDRRSYQIPPSAARQAVRDALADEEEGADILMVKPAMPYLDILHELRGCTRLPLAAYQVSGEYAMLKHAAAAGAFNERVAALETSLAIKRAGADIIVTYYAEDLCRWLTEV